MMLPRLTLNVSGIEAARTVAAIERAERMGLSGIWAPTMGSGPDALTTLAAAAMRTERISLGTGVLPAFTRHPLAMAQQALAVESLAPGRLRLGVGASHAPGMRGTFGVDMQMPLGRLRAYVTVLKAALQRGSVDHESRFYTAHARLPKAPGTPVLIAALGPAAFRLAGEAADGAVSWLCPPRYLLDAALPAMRSGAEAAGRSTPPLVAGLPIAVCDDAEAVRTAVRGQLATYVRAVFYQRMLVGAGYDEAKDGVWSDAMIDAAVVWGDEDTVTARLAALAEAGIDEVAVTPLLIGPDPRAAMQRTLTLLAALVASG
jgi:F420-dependent oxidoreductase-like protein